LNKSINIKNALISVFDKSNIIELSKQLLQNNITLFSTKGTASQLKNSGLTVNTISTITHFPEIMNGQIKTLHPKIYAGILRNPEIDSHIIKKYNIITFDLIVVNFYTFDKKKLDNDNIKKNILKNIDIGGPTMVRAAIKNFSNIIILTDPNDYEKIIQKIKINNISLEDKFYLAMKAFNYLTSYDKSILDSLKNSQTIKNNFFPNVLNVQYIKKQNLRYGENSHQKAALYTKNPIIKGSICEAYQIQGKRLSYNNISDAESALQCIKEFNKPTCVIVKHENPCGVSTKQNILEAYLSAYKSDPISAFGGIIAINKPLDQITAENILKNQFIEIIITPAIDNKALRIIQKKKQIRILIINDLETKNNEPHLKHINGGLLLQESDIDTTTKKKWTIVTHRKPNAHELKDAKFCWKVVKFVKSNAIVYSKNETTVAIGAGQMSRILSTIIANIQAKKQNQTIKGCTLASDAFLPFRDNIDQAAKLGISCIIQPGGSIRDSDIIKAANQHNISMIFTHIRHFKH